MAGEQDANSVHTSFRPTLAWKATLLILIPAAALPGEPTWTLMFLLLFLVTCGLDVLLGWWNLQGVFPQPPPAESPFVRESFATRIPIRNRSRRHAARDLVLAHGLEGEDRLRPFAYIDALEADSQRLCTTQFSLPRRGRHREYRLTLSSSFPFGLFEWRRGFRLPADFLVLPRLGELQNLEVLERASRRDLAAEARAVDVSEDFYALREWRQGMSQRLVHWKVSARQRRLVVRELRGHHKPSVHVLLSSFVVGAISDEVGKPRYHASFEKAVGLTATLIEHFLRKNTAVRFSLLGPEGFQREVQAGRKGLFSVLAQLAEVRCHPALEKLQLPKKSSGNHDHRILVLASGDVGHGLLRTPELQASSKRGRLDVFDVDSPEVRRVFRPMRREIPRFRMEGP